MSAVVVIEKYRTEHDLIDQRIAIGPQPSDYHGIIDWNRAAETISDALDVISPPTRTIVQPQRPAIERRSPGIEL